MIPTLYRGSEREYNYFSHLGCIQQFSSSLLKIKNADKAYRIEMESHEKHFEDQMEEIRAKILENVLARA